MAIPGSMNPRGSVTDPKKKVAVAPALRARGSAVQRAVAATAGKKPIPKLGELEADYFAGPSEEKVSQRQYARQQREEALSGYESVIQRGFTPREFDEERPAFDAQSVTRALPFLTIMAAVGGKLTKVNALGMMNAMTAGIKGLQEGNRNAYKQALFDYTQNRKEFEEREAVRRQIYDFQLQAAKDGYAVAKARAESADAAVKDEMDEKTNRLDVRMSLDKARQDFLKDQAEIALRYAQAGKAYEKTGEYPKSAYDQLNADDKKEIKQAAQLFQTFSEGADAAERLGETETVQQAIGRTFFPILTQFVEFSQYEATKNIKTQEAFVDALDNAKVQQIIADLIRKNAGLSQTAREIENIRQYIGTNKKMQTDAFLRLQRALAQDMQQFSRRGAAHQAAVGDLFQRSADDLYSQADTRLSGYREKLRGKDAAEIPQGFLDAGLDAEDWKATPEAEKQGWRRAEATRKKGR